MIKNIVFDIGNVLVRFQPDEAMREIGIEENKIAALALSLIHILPTENTVIFVSLFLPDIMLHISKRKTKKFVM